MPVTTSFPKLILLLLLTLGGLSCQRPTSFFFVKNAGAVMPVKVGGNPDASTFIILLPGGPAGDGQVYRRVFPVFKKAIEPHHRMVYYDQRGSGNCQGRYDTASLTLDQLSEDLDRIVTVLERQYEQPRIYLLGYSYGGALGLTYLLDPHRRDRIRGFIGLAGAFDRRRQAEYRQRLIRELLQQWVAEGYIDSYNSLTDEYDCAAQADPEQCRQDSTEVGAKVAARFAQVKTANQFPFNGATLLRLLSYVFFSQSNPILSGVNESQNGKFYQPEFDSLLLSDRIGTVTTPTLLLNGRWDTNVPFPDARTVYDALGAVPERKTLIVLEQSGHLPMLTEPEVMARAVLDFIEKNEKHHP